MKVHSSSPGRFLRTVKKKQGLEMWVLTSALQLELHLCQICSGGSNDNFHLMGLPGLLQL